MWPIARVVLKILAILLNKASAPLCSRDSMMLSGPGGLKGLNERTVHFTLSHDTTLLVCSTRRVLPWLSLVHFMMFEPG